MLTLVSTAATASGDPVVASSNTTPTRQPEGPDTPAVQPRPTPWELTAADVQDAPIPGDEGGLLTSLDPGDSAFRVVARGVLFIPKLVIAAALSPVRGAIWADDRYRLEDLYYRVFYNADRTIGLFPTATYTSGFGVAAGARFVDRQLFGEHESLALEATTGAVTGETYRLGVLGSFRSGQRISPWFQLGLDASFERHPADPFYGIGNGNLVPPTSLPINPQTDVTAVETYHRYQEARLAVLGDARVIDGLHLLGTGAVTDLRFGRSTTVTEGQYVDTWIADPGDHHCHYVKHYAIDFGKSLGAMGEIGLDWWRGAYYRIDLAEMVRTFFTAGLSARPWEEREAPRLRGVSSLFEARTFDPGSWHPDSPGYLPFLTSDRFDKFWGAKIIARFTRDQIHAAVEAGRFSDSRAIEYLTDTLVARQRATVAYWFARVNPVRLQGQHFR